ARRVRALLGRLRGPRRAHGARPGPHATESERRRGRGRGAASISSLSQRLANQLVALPVPGLRRRRRALVEAVHRRGRVRERVRRVVPGYRGTIFRTTYSTEASW